MTDVELWVLVDENGDYEINADGDELQAPAGLASRLIKVSLRIPTPKALVMSGTVAAEATGGELTAV